MRKLFVLFLILSLILPAAALAEDPDPIVGYWYIYADFDLYPEMKSISSVSFDNALSVYRFESSGVVYLLENDITNGTSTPTYTPAGKWTKNGNDYEYDIIGMDHGTMVIEDDDLWISYQNNAFMMRLRRIYPFNFYKDYKY